MLALVFGALIVVFIVKYLRDNRQNDSSELPGPWGLPIFGHLLSLGSVPEITLTNWKKIYGPIYGLKFAKFPVVVLNDTKIIKEAFSMDCVLGRPAILNLVSASESKGFAFNDAPRNWEQREFAEKTLQKVRLAKSEHENRINIEIGVFLNLFKSKCKTSSASLSSDAQDLFQSRMPVHNFFQYPVTNSVWMAIVGNRFKENDSTLQKMHANVASFTDNTENRLNQLSWFFPPISRILNFLGMNTVVNVSKDILAFVNEEIQNCKADYVPNQPKHFTHAYFDKIGETGNPNSSFHASVKGEQVASTREILFGAIDTTTTVLDWMLLYMASRLDIQQKLQQEIDNVLQTFSESTRRTPCLSDQAYMPYTVAVINEVLRMSTITPTLVYRRTTEDVVLRGYKIPKDTIVIPNVYGAHYDPATWPDPETFIPERFLESDGTPNKSSRDIMVFGFGKRKCIGEQIGRDQLFLITTSFLQHFSVQHPGAIPMQERIFAMVVAPQKFDLLFSERFASVIE